MEYWYTLIVKGYCRWINTFGDYIWVNTVQDYLLPWNTCKSSLQKASQTNRSTVLTSVKNETVLVLIEKFWLRHVLLRKRRHVWKGRGESHNFTQTRHFRNFISFFNFVELNLPWLNFLNHNFAGICIKTRIMETYITKHLMHIISPFS